MTEQAELIGHDGADAAFQNALANNHLHHGWIVKGPSGIGKYLQVRTICAQLLGANDPEQGMRVWSGGHPDLKTVQRQENDKGQLKQDISVDQIRELNHFFSLKPALAGWRIGVVDALDELNMAGMNALLKTLEEPPKRSLLFLIYHGHEPLLPTIRSRCQILRMSALSGEACKKVLAMHGVSDPILGDLAKGRPGKVIGQDPVKLAGTVQSTRTLLRAIGNSPSTVLPETLTSAVASVESLSVFAELLMDWCATRATDNPGLSKTWLDLQAIYSASDELNLTALETASKLWSTLYNVVRELEAA